MNESEMKLLKSIEKEAMSFIEKCGYVPYQITLSDHEFKLYKQILKKGQRAYVYFNGIRWTINVQCCTTILPQLSESWGRV